MRYAVVAAGMCMNAVKGTGMATAGYAGKKYGIVLGAGAESME